MAPRKLTLQDIKNRFEKYGYIILSDKYVNSKTPLLVYDAQQDKKLKLTAQELSYRVTHRDRAEFDFNNILPIEHQPEQQYLTSFQRFLRRMQDNKVIRDASEEERMRIYQEYQSLCRMLNQKRPIVLQWHNDMLPKHRLFAFIEALKSITKPDKLIRIKTVDGDHVESNYSLNYETLNYFNDLLNDVPVNELSDSTNDLFNDHSNWDTVIIKFDVLAKRHGGFYPYLNKSSYPLEQFGIFSTLNLNNYKDNCFIQALESSNAFNSDEMALIRSCVNTRLVKVEDISVVSNLMNTHFVIRCIDDKGETVLKQIRPDKGDKAANGDVSPETARQSKKVTLILYKYHFMAYHQVNITEYYLRHKAELDQKYGNDPKRFLILNDEGKVGTGKMSLIKLLTLLHELKLMEPISINDQLRIAAAFNCRADSQITNTIDELFRPKQVKDKNLNQTRGFSKKMGYDGYKLFGVHLDSVKLNIYYDRLQQVIDDIGVDINVRAYTSYPALMEAIMYKYGCFENVFELASPLAHRIRNQLVFPVPHTDDDKPFYSNKKLYYIDLNGAYLSCVKSIPAGKCNDDLEFTEQNTKIKDLIERMYQIRKSLSAKDEILAKTVKLLMTCCWGMSIKREKLFKKHYPKNREEYIDSNLPYVVEVGSDFIKTISSISVHWSHPQFAKSVLDEFSRKMKAVCDLVGRVYYHNVDALLIDEEGYKKVVEAGLIGDELGKFKIEHVFNEIAIMSKRKYVATLEDGTLFYHNGNRPTDYEWFKQRVLSSPDTTVLT